MLTWCCERVQVWWKVEDPYVGTIEWKASIMKRTRQQRFFGLQRQRALADPELAAMQTEALSNTVRRPTLFHSIDSFPRCFQEVSISSFLTKTCLCVAQRERRRLERRARRQRIQSARESAPERAALYAKLQLSMESEADWQLRCAKDFPTDT